jgi:hypothetical protein
MFRRILSAARHRDLDFSNLLKYELTTVPSSLFFEDGSMRKSPKAELGKKIKSFCQPLFEIKEDSILALLMPWVYYKKFLKNQ